MEKIITIKKEQEILLDQFRGDPYLVSHFYFTGGTALSLYYLQHRESIDLDFFSEEFFDPQLILTKVTTWAKKLNAIVDYVAIEDTHVFNLTFPDKQIVKVDFAFYPHKRLEKSTLTDGVPVDSILDIAVNKLLATQQRTEVKDFVDLYFLLQKFTVWDLMEGVRVKFRVNLDPFIIGSDFMKVENFEFLPKMIRPLTLSQLKSFYKQKAQDIAGKSIA